MANGNEHGPEFDRVAIQAFKEISERWQLDAPSRSRLLEVPESVIQAWFEHPELAHLEREQLERISYLIGIYGALHAFFGDPNQQSADDWPRRSNLYFGGRTALDRMLDGIEGVIEVHEYALNAAYGG